MSFLSGLLGPPSKDHFAGMMIAELRRSGISEGIRYDAADFCLHIEGPSSHKLYLHNAYAEYGQVPRKERQGVLRRYASHVNEPSFPDSFDDVRPNLLPRIRQRSFYDANALRLSEKGEGPRKIVHRVFSEHLGLGVVIDWPDRISESWEDPVGKWGITFDEELEIAAENLWARSTEPFQELIPGFWQSPWRDNHDASRLFLTNLIRQLRVKGDPVCMLPNRDVLLVTGSEDVEGLAAMAALTETEFEGGRAISAIPVTLDGDRWNPFMVSADHPAFTALRKLRYSSLIRDYQDEKAARDEFNEKNGIDIFVASYTVYENKKENTLRSFGVWSEGVPTFLPVTDAVGFVRFKGGKALPGMIDAPWDRIVATVGHRMKPLETHPPRYLVESFPSDGELERLKG